MSVKMQKLSANLDLIGAAIADAQRLSAGSPEALAIKWNEKYASGKAELITADGVCVSTILGIEYQQKNLTFIFRLKVINDTSSNAHHFGDVYFVSLPALKTSHTEQRSNLELSAFGINLKLKIKD